MAAILIPVILFVMLTSLSALGWWLMARRPAKWTAMVEKENNFWRDKGVISSAFAEKMKRWETSQSLKALAIIASCLGLIGLLFTTTALVKVILVEHQRLRMPFNPVFKPTPQRPPVKPLPMPPPKRR